MIVSFTGHREIDEPVATVNIDALLEQLAPSDAIVGGAKGADTLAAERCAAFGIPYIMALPHPNYPFHYKLDEDPRWNRTVKLAANIVYVTSDKKWHWSLNFERNVWMLNHSDLLIAISRFDPNGDHIPARGGTAHCVRSARGSQFPVLWAKT
jgi:hypothetical protein